MPDEWSPARPRAVVSSEEGRSSATRGQLEGRIVIITGGAGGAGRAASLLFAREGAKLVIADIDGAAGRSLEQVMRSEGFDATFIEADVSVAQHVERTVALALRLHQRVDILFNHAGDIIIKPLVETTEDDWDWLMRNNAKSVFLMTKAVLPGMLERGRGTIVTTSSVSAVASTPLESLYCASKAAMHQFCRAVAIEYRDRGIRSNLVCPGFVRTPHGRREIEQLNDRGIFAGEQEIAAMQGRICEPEEVAEVALFLASDRSSFVNGAELFVDNGLTAI
jgi:NAD(P)-dependent dehydrogenase (short-subunit alcohol dehydrogenase family)